MPVLAVNPTYDGQIQVVFNASWAGARDAASGTVDDTDADYQVRGEFNGSQYNCGRGFLTFSLATIPLNATITAATLGINVDTTSAIDAAHGTLHLVQSTQASTSVLIGSDYAQFGTSNYAATVDGSTTGAKTFTLNATGIAYLQTKIGLNPTLCIRTKKDFDNTQPTGEGNMAVSSVDNGTGGNRPLLTVTYTVPSTDDYAYLM